MRSLFAICAVLLGFALPAAAEVPLEQAQLAELDRIRTEIADDVHLAAFDLIDELIYGWTQEPVFENATPVVLAGVTVPVGLGTGMQAMLENHIASVLGSNPTSHIELVHCPVCTAVVVHSGPEGTVVSRGIDDPRTLEELGESTGRHALFIDIEAEGSWLVLRARLTELTPDLPIVWAHTIASSTSTPALLRDGNRLVSAEEARKEYLDALRGRGPLTIPVKLAVRSYKPGTNNANAPPFLWLQAGVEFGTKARGWTSSLMLGYSFIPQAYQGVLGQVRVSRLVTGRMRSTTRPDLYIFGGAAVMSVWGTATGAFLSEPFTADNIITTLNEEGPRTTFGAMHLGADLRMGKRFGFAFFLESMPGLNNSDNIGGYLRIAGLDIQTLGFEVSVCF